MSWHCRLLGQWLGGVEGQKGHGGWPMEEEGVVAGYTETDSIPLLYAVCLFGSSLSLVHHTHPTGREGQRGTEGIG